MKTYSLEENEIALMIDLAKRQMRACVPYLDTAAPEPSYYKDIAYASTYVRCYRIASKLGALIVENPDTLIVANLLLENHILPPANDELNQS